MGPGLGPGLTPQRLPCARDGRPGGCVHPLGPQVRRAASPFLSPGWGFLEWGAGFSQEENVLAGRGGGGDGGIRVEKVSLMQSKREGEICLKIRKGEGSQLWARAMQGTGAPDVRSTTLPGSGLLWGLRRGRGRGGLYLAGARSCRAELRTRRLPPVMSLGKVAHGAVPVTPAPLPQSGDMTALCGVLTPSSRIPASSSPGLSPSSRDCRGSPGKRKDPSSGRRLPAL
ncbi:uncharacterized protein [Macaca nemestrina]|uniref:uncharacterized protein n=1 Tax=Macaca nemestrina TaxID=9545 RepID=UPI0039B8FC50